MKKLSIFFFILLVTDFLTSNLIFKKTHFWNKEKFSKKYWRVLSPIYNHDLLPNIDVIEPWGGKYKKRLVTNSLGFRDFLNKKDSNGRQYLHAPDSFFLSPTIPAEVEIIINSLDLKKSVGPVSLPVYLLKIYTDRL